MKKASKIILIIAGILSILGIFVIGATMITLVMGAIAGKPFELLYEVIESYVKPVLEEVYGNESGGYDPEAVKGAMTMIYCVVVAVPSLFEMLFSLIIGILCLVGANAKKKGILIAIIVFSVLGGTLILPLVGAILGIIGLNRENRRVNAQPKATISETK